LGHAIGAANIPPKVFASRDLYGAATLMANHGLDPILALEHAILRDSLYQGHFTPAEFDDIFGQGASDAIQSGAAAQLVSSAEPRRDANEAGLAARDLGTGQSVDAGALCGSIRGLASESTAPQPPDPRSGESVP